MRLALYQPDIPQNTGTLMRLCACLGIPMDLIEPCGFVYDDRRVRRAGMDYMDHLDLTRHPSWEHFQAHHASGRVVLLTTKGSVPHVDFRFEPTDILMLGRESAGVPDDVHNAVDARVKVPMMPPARSLNVAIAAALVVGEAARQTNLFSSLSVE